MFSTYLSHLSELQSVVRSRFKKVVLNLRHFATTVMTPDVLTNRKHAHWHFICLFEFRANILGNQLYLYLYFIEHRRNKYVKVYTSYLLCPRISIIFVIFFNSDTNVKKKRFCSNGCAAHGQKKNENIPRQSTCYAPSP